MELVDLSIVTSASKGSRWRVVADKCIGNQGKAIKLSHDECNPERRSSLYGLLHRYGRGFRFRTKLLDGFVYVWAEKREEESRG